jgi:hypothetical protein
VNEHLKDRIERAIDNLSDERGYQILDYIEFLGSKYAERSSPTNIFAKMTDKAEDLLRAGKMPIDAISGTVTFFDGASKVMKGLASAAQSVVEEASRTAQNIAAQKPPATPSAGEGESASPDPGAKP